MHVVDADLQIVLTNKAFVRWCEQLGLETDLVGRTVFEVFPFLPDRVRDEYRRVFDTGESLLTQECTQVGAQELVTETHKAPIPAGDQVIQVITLVRHIAPEYKNGSKLGLVDGR